MSSDKHILSTLLVTWTDEELLEAYRMVGAEYKTRKNEKAADNKSKLYPSCKVSWTGSKSGACTGRVVKVKTKKAIVEEDISGTRWDIPMSMLTIITS